jgi:hypothetical protein
VVLAQKHLFIDKQVLPSRFDDIERLTLPWLRQGRRKKDMT